MCGIAGVWGQHRKEDLERAMAALRHRGPDGEGIFQDRKCAVGLAHTRLSILDPRPCGNQPMVGNDGKVVLVYNGEIYNYQELKKDLTSSQKEWAVDSRQWAGGGDAEDAANSKSSTSDIKKWRSDSDTEVLLRLYLETRRKGGSILDMLPRLEGMFAFAIWDAREESLWVARDAFGVKPLYLSQCPGGFSFASEIKALRWLARDPGTLDRNSLARYLSFLWCPGEGTPLTNIKKLPAGHFVQVKNGRVVERGPWRRRGRPGVCPHPDLEGAGKEAVQRLRTSVHRQMVADVPVGAFLSGGLDSSAIVAFAREINPEIRCFTIQATDWREEEVTDDLPYAVAAAKHLNVPLEIVPMDSRTMANELEEMVGWLEEPLADPAALNILHMSRLARLAGVKVLLSGLGGDDLYAGYRRHQAVQWQRHWDRLPGWVRATLQAGASAVSVRNQLFRRIQKACRALQASPESRLAKYFLWGEREIVSGLLSKTDDSETLDQILRPMMEILARREPGVTDLQEMLELERTFFLPDHNLAYTDKMSMAAGVEVRVPFLADRNLEFSRSLPDRFLISRNETKIALKKGLEAWLPREVIYRPKSGLGAPIRKWMRKDLSGKFLEIIASREFRDRGVFKPEAVRKLFQDNSERKVDAGYLLFSVMCIELWCRKFMNER